MAGSPFTQVVPRVCRVRGSRDPDGDLVELETGFLDETPDLVTAPSELVSGALAMPGIIAESGVMVLLGEPGAGKTSTFMTIVDGLPRLQDPGEFGDQDSCVWVSGGDLTDVTYADLVGDYLDLLPTYGENRSARTKLTMVIDQTDESPMLRQLAGRLNRSLRNRDVTSLRLLIACRTADYPERLTTVLTEHFKACHRVDLAPLRRSDAIALVDSAGISGEALVTAAVESGAAVLASVPLTLELLVLTFKRDGCLQGLPRDLFAQGCELLANEPDEGRSNSEWSTTAQQRLFIAGRIAALMLLSGHKSIWRGNSLEAGRYDLPDGMLVELPDFRTPDGSLKFTAQAIKETLATALFSSGPDRRTQFRHSSLCAYLAARYLIKLETPQKQLSNLFLVGDAENDTASIPVPLRETAAWLAALDPDHTDWLATADPESLAAHSALVRSDTIRRIIVDTLFSRALEVELSDTRWQLTRWDLRHAQLDRQIASALESDAPESVEDWSAIARIRLAVRLSQGAASARLSIPLLRIAQDESWPHTERRLAANAAFNCDPEASAPVLKEILQKLADREYAQNKDPDDGIRGTILDLLWPDFLDVTEVLDALLPIQNRHLYGQYRRFLGGMPARCTDSQIGAVLDWIGENAQLNSGMSKQIDAIHDDEIPEAAVNGTNYSRDALPWIEETFVDSAVDRALRAENFLTHLPKIASIVVPLLHHHESLHVPATLGEVDEQGREEALNRERRHLFLDALLRASLDSPFDVEYSAWLTLRGWKEKYKFSISGKDGKRRSRSSPIDESDLEWAVEQADAMVIAGRSELGDAYAVLASHVFNPEDCKAFEFAYSKKGSHAWPRLAHAFDPIEIDSPLAQSLRRNYAAQHPTWEESPAFIADQRTRFADAQSGNNEALWRLLWSLQFDPETGHGEEIVGDFSNWPGAVIFTAEELGEFPEIFLRYVSQEDDRADDWIGTTSVSKWAWAGYVCLCSLYGSGRVADIPEGAWDKWTGAVLAADRASSSDSWREAKSGLLHMAATHAPDSLARRVRQLVEGDVAGGRQTTELEVLDYRWARQVAATLENLVVELPAVLWPALADIGSSVSSAAPSRPRLVIDEGSEAHVTARRTWHALLSSLLSLDSDSALLLSSEILSRLDEGSQEVEPFVLVAQSLLETDPAKHWSRVKATVAIHPTFSRSLAEACARGDTNHIIQGAVDEIDLADIYRWLSTVYPGVTNWIAETHYVDAEEQAREWRDSIPGAISGRGTRNAVICLRQLSSEFPERLGLTSALLAARSRYQAYCWVQTSVEEVSMMLSDPKRRVIRSAVDLLNVVHEAIAAIAEDIPQHGELLWDRTPGKRRRKTDNDSESVPDVWRPKPEAALCAYVAHELLLRLAGLRVSVNREVLVLPTDPYGAGDRTDILVEMAPGEPNDWSQSMDEKFRVVIEVKGAWNPGLLEAQKEQLVDMYLKQVQTDAGVYLVGWYPIRLWDTTGDSRKTQARKHSLAGLRAALEAQAQEITSVAEVSVKPVVMNIPRPHQTRS
ncbi:NACHT domain-containing protein [Streptomyces sp. NPDC058954]|uniref:NACHT domain-containing protein n=1 Tax=Streptomyces sp. NPDC058954 TaxID=3346677 RepID=UPI0036741CC8